MALEYLGRSRRDTNVRMEIIAGSKLRGICRHKPFLVSAEIFAGFRVQFVAATATKIIHNPPQSKLTSAPSLWHSEGYAIMYLRSLAKSSTSFERKIDSPRKMSFSPV